jgi:hypothetical protein
MSRRRRSHYRPSLGWILGVAFEGTLTRLGRPVQEFTCVRCCGSPRASSPHGLAAPASRVSRRATLRAVASGSRLLPTRPVKDFHLQSSAHAGHTSAAALRSAATAFDARYADNERGLDCAPIWGEDPAPIDTLQTIATETAPAYANGAGRGSFVAEMRASVPLKSATLLRPLTANVKAISRRPAKGR